MSERLKRCSARGPCGRPRSSRSRRVRTIAPSWTVIKVIEKTCGFTSSTRSGGGRQNLREPPCHENHGIRSTAVRSDSSFRINVAGAGRADAGQPVSRHAADGTRGDHVARGVTSGVAREENLRDPVDGHCGPRMRGLRGFAVSSRSPPQPPVIARSCGSGTSWAHDQGRAGRTVTIALSEQRRTPAYASAPLESRGGVMCDVVER